MNFHGTKLKIWHDQIVFTGPTFLHTNFSVKCVDRHLPVQMHLPLTSGPQNLSVPRAHFFAKGWANIFQTGPLAECLGQCDMRHWGKGKNAFLKMMCVETVEWSGEWPNQRRTQSMRPRVLNRNRSFLWEWITFQIPTEIWCALLM